MLGLITLAVCRALSILMCVNVCVCTFNTDSLSTCGPQLPAGFRISTETEMEIQPVSCRQINSVLPFNLESLTVETQQLSSPLNIMKENTQISYKSCMMNGHCMCLQHCRCIFEHISTYCFDQKSCTVLAYYTQHADISWPQEKKGREQNKNTFCIIFAIMFSRIP